MREDLEDEFTTTTTKTTKVLVYDADKEETVKVVSQEERERELRQREIELEEHRRREELRFAEYSHISIISVDNRSVCKYQLPFVTYFVVLRGP